jgi:hypothetical protein
MTDEPEKSESGSGLIEVLSWSLDTRRKDKKTLRQDSRGRKKKKKKCMYLLNTSLEY